MTTPMQVLLVTGGRDLEERVKVFQTLDVQHARWPIALLMHGACPTGSDNHCELWAKSRQVPYLGIPAKWIVFGNSAGPRRNTSMLNFMGIVPTRCLAFPGGTGTADMTNQASRAGIPVEEAWECVR